MGAGCPFITCAVKKKGIEVCWQCAEHETCERWAKHRTFGKKHDTFTCYQRLEDNIAFIQQNGVHAFEEAQKIREHLLKEMLHDFNEGRSKRYYTIATTVFEIKELETALTQAKKDAAGLDMKGKSRYLHALLDAISARHNYHLKLRK